MPDSENVYWDSCAWIGLINAEPAKVDPLVHVYESARRGQYDIWTSTIAFVEVFRLDFDNPAVRPFADESLDKIKAAMEQAFVKLIPLDLEVGRKARGLRRAHRLGPADAVHLASALVWSISPLHTWDGSHLLPFNGHFSCKDAKQLEICIPGQAPPGPLFMRSTN